MQSALQSALQSADYSTDSYQTCTPSVSYQWVIDRKYDRRGCGSPSGYGALGTNQCEETLSVNVLIMEPPHLYNTYMDKGLFPKTWSIDMVTPIPNNSNVSRNRMAWGPISITLMSLSPKVLIKFRNIWKTMIYFVKTNMVSENLDVLL